jgi:hypothetical protein
MTRFELLHLLVAQARANGFEFRKWYISRLRLPWQTTRHAIETLSEQRRYYALLFAHEFASSFWKAGERITFQVPTQTFTRRKADGTIGTVSRKGYTRRSARDDAWRYHLRELAVAEEPLRYMRKYLRVEDELDLEMDVELDDDLNAGHEAELNAGLSVDLAASAAAELPTPAVAPPGPSAAWESKRISIVPMRPKAG